MTLAVATLFVALLAPILAVAATTWTVNDRGDIGGTTCGVGLCELRDAINKAASGDTITFDPSLAGATIALTRGELSITDKSLTISGIGANLLTISGNHASRIFNIASSTAPPIMTVSISGLTLSNGGAGVDTSGGAVFISKPNSNTAVLNVNLDRLAIQSSTAGTTANTTYSQGGGIYSQRAVLRITNSTISGNTSYGPSANGGGVLATGSYSNGSVASNGNALTIINSTITGNAAVDPANGSVPTGGGVEFAFGTATILNSTIDNNTAVHAANLHNGNASSTGFPFTLRNSIVANANGSDAAGPNIGGPISDAEYALVDNDASVTYTGTKVAVTTGQNPNLGALGSNGGPTPTQVPASGSPAINTGDPAGCKDDAGATLTTDQRGSQRPDPGNRCDLGAYERFDLALTPAVLPPATAGIAYGVTVGVAASQGIPTYAVTSGSLAPFTLNSATGAISGSSTVAAILSFTITATDQLKNTGSKAYTLVINGGPASTLVVDSFPSPTTAGAAHNVRVTAKDTFGNVANLYTGTVHLTSSDGAAVLPANYTFVAGDNGVHALGVTLKTAGTQSIAATDTVTASITGAQTGIVVNPAAAATLALSGYPSPVTAGTSGVITVTATDAYGNTATGYAGTIHFTSSDGAVALPANSTLANGVGTFNATLKTAGTQSITATDTLNGALTATQGGIVVNAGAATGFTAGGYPSPATAGTSGSFTVTARDAFGNLAVSYAGTVHFSSSDGAAILPANSGLAGGVGTFNATLKTAGTQGIAAIDTGNASITGTQAGIVVNAAAAATFMVSGYPSPVAAGSSNGFSVTAKDAFGNTATGYAGIVHFTSSDSAAMLPANAPLTNGVGLFNATLKTVGTQSLTATDTATASVTGTQTGIVVNPGAGATFTVSTYPSPVTAGTSNSFTVTAKDSSGNTATGYTGTVHFTSSDGSAVLPANATLSSGVGTFSATLKTAGTQSLTATDTVTASITGKQTGIVVNAAAASVLAVSGYPSPITAGTSNTFSVTATDAYGNTVTGYTGTVHFTSSDTAGVLPANGVLTNGVGTFSAALKTSGTQSITATDTVTASITGAQTGIVVNAGAVTKYIVSGYPSLVAAGTSNGFSVIAKDAFGNTATGYVGTAHFTSSDSAAVLPADAPLTNGIGLFNATLRTVGTQSLTATDTATASITGTQAGIVVNPGAAATFLVNAYPSPVTAGTSHGFTVTAKDASGNTATGYTGTVHLTSTDAQGALPADYVFTAGDAGVRAFTATLKTSGTQSITATDTVTASITGAQTGIVVNAGAATTLAVSGYPSPVTAGTVNGFTVAAKDAFGNVAMGYTGTVHLTSTDAQAVLPADYLFTVGDAGTHAFTATLKTAGTRSITATDTATASITGTQASITVNAAAASTLNVSGYPSPVKQGSSNPFTVTAKDAFGNTATGYAGTVHLTSSDGMAVLPADYGFAAIDNGVHVFNATLKTAGTQSITATDTASGTIAGAQMGIVVKPMYVVSASVNGGNGTISPTTQSVDAGSPASLTLVPSAGYHALIDPATTCPGGTLSGGTYTTANITADCSVVAKFVADALPVLAITVTDRRTHARYGMLLNYTVTVTNSGGDAAGVTLANTVPAQLDAVNTTWICDSGGGGATCSATGTGALADSGVVIPAGRSLTWQVTAPVRVDAVGATVDYSVSASRAGSSVSATDSDILVIFRDGFDVPYGDGTGTAESPTAMFASCPADPAPEIFDDTRMRVLTVPTSLAKAPVDALLVARTGTVAGFRVERLNFGATPRVRLVVIAQDGSEHASAWATTTAGAALAVATANAADGGRVLLLEGAASPLVMPLPAGITSTFRIQTQPMSEGACQ
ncbi:choice-of-anchor Q domain-containing protein [Dokdonella soli]|uniref:DUF11 domain-containing protein n=2 Tax=Dokdonella soli TaxID=529810 RepID=A0ABP3TWW3_9GAMM